MVESVHFTFSLSFFCFLFFFAVVVVVVVVAVVVAVPIIVAATFVIQRMIVHAVFFEAAETTVSFSPSLNITEKSNPHMHNEITVKLCCAFFKTGSVDGLVKHGCQVVDVRQRDDQRRQSPKSARVGSHHGQLVRPGWHVIVQCSCHK